MRPGHVAERCAIRVMFHPTLDNKVVWRLANRYPGAYERHRAWMFPAWFVSVELKAVK